MTTILRRNHLPLLALALGAISFAHDAAAQSCGLSNGKKATGAPIAVGALVGQTGPDDFSSSGKAAAAYFKCVNENGGINGRPVDYEVIDDKWNPETAAQSAAKLVGVKKVVAMVGSSSFVDCGVNGALYNKESLMVVAGVGVPRECFHSKNIVPMNSGPRLSSTLAMQAMAVQAKPKSMVCIIPNLPSIGNWACEGAVQWAKANGIIAHDTIVFDAASADPTSLVLQAAAKKTDVILFNAPKGLLVPMLAAAEQQGLGSKVRIFSPASGYSEDVPKAVGPNWAGKWLVGMEFEPLDSTGKDNLNWRAVMGKYGAASDPRDTFSQAGYLSARLFTETALKMDPAKIDRDSMTKALRMVKDFKSDILCRPFYVGDGARHNANNYGRAATPSGTGWKTVTECIAVGDPELSDLRAAEAKH
jgi:branched-chain amino acid transport system substrate-binding protein